MAFQDDPEIIRWRLHLTSSPQKTHGFLATSEGRQRFWADSAEEHDGVIEFKFSNGQSWSSRVIENSPPNRFAVEYFQGSRVVFDLVDDGAGGTDLTLTESGLPTAARVENMVGWVTVLLNLKAAVDFGIDLRNKDPKRSWEWGYVDV